jgi:hypothetical protein
MDVVNFVVIFLVVVGVGHLNRSVGRASGVMDAALEVLRDEGLTYEHAHLLSERIIERHSPLWAIYLYRRSES